MFTVTCHCTLITAQNDWPLWYVIHYQHCYHHMSMATPAHIRYTTTAPNSVTVVNRTHAHMTFLNHDNLWN